jgi:hypothetical protein
VARIKDLEPDLEIGVTNENGRILLVTVSRAIQEPALIRIWIFDIETRIQALDKIPGEMIVDPGAIVFAKDDPGLALRISDDVLPISSGRAMNSVQCDDGLMASSCPKISRDSLRCANDK